MGQKGKDRKRHRKGKTGRDKARVWVRKNKDRKSRQKGADMTRRIERVGGKKRGQNGENRKSTEKGKDNRQQSKDRRRGTERERQD